MRPCLLALVLVACGSGVDERGPATRSPERPARSAVAPAPSPAEPSEPVLPPAPLGRPHAPAVVTTCTPPARTEIAPQIREGIVYSTVDGQALALDLASPRAAGPHPVVLVFHGGGWSAGERAHVRDDVATLATLGFAAAAIDYRLVGEGHNTSPAQVADARCAVRYLRSNARSLDIDPDRMAALGYSAGGQLALMLGAASDVVGLDECSDTDTSPAVRAVIGYFAPTDLRPSAPFSRAADRVIARFLGVSRARDPAAAALASPIVHVDSSDAATLLVHGTADAVVPVEQSRAMAQALRESGVPVTLVELEGARHGFRMLGRQARIRTGTCTSIAFLRAAL